MIDFGRDRFTDLAAAERCEWLVTNGLGGFASGTIAGSLTRRYHGLLFAALRPPGGRTLLAATLDEIATVGDRTFRLSTIRWAGGAVDPAGFPCIERFRIDGTVPVWTFALDGARVEKRIFMEQAANTTHVTYSLVEAESPVHLHVKALTDYRDLHAGTRAGSMPMRMELLERGVRITAFDGASPYVIAASRGSCSLIGIWYDNFDLCEERARGLNDREDHFCAAAFDFDLPLGEDVAIVASAGPDANPIDPASARKRRRAHELGVIGGFREAAGDSSPAYIERLALAADQFIVRRGVSPNAGYSIVAGYHWFGEWGRDTMIALPGLLLATGRIEEARSVLQTWAQFVDQGMLPNQLPAGDEPPTYNSVDASLWFVEAVRQYVQKTGDDATLRSVFPVLREIVARYREGTRFGIHGDLADGLLYAGEPGEQLTWMDGKVGEWVVTPRIGKPVEVNALWCNALTSVARLAERIGESADAYSAWSATARRGFSRFWNGSKGYCFDVLDGPHGDESALRPNQVIAAAMTDTPFSPQQVRAVVDACGPLIVPCALRTLSPDDVAYKGTYAGTQVQRDGAYHQGTAWAWLLGWYVVAHLRAYGDTRAALELLAPLEAHLHVAGLGSVSEIFDGDPPHEPRGCIAQAWSVGEALRAYRAIVKRS
ncbi:MAG TPA: amylo-alpha-1,6-glucosidase [Candidatus Eremiobacteraceae bacterium]|nr:amylo-alpha-1,6-glucosidase [Candidatus Eremiobacteraceae bacterium]